jgi:hypothetical protein
MKLECTRTLRSVVVKVLVPAGATNSTVSTIAAAPVTASTRSQ